MVVVAAVAFAAGIACLAYGARALRVRRALARLRATDDPAEEVTDADDAPTNWVLPPEERETPPADPASAVSIERGVALLALGAVCLLFGFLGL